jgi:L-seryl-tRNA(Ser) seleniumtransferase
MHRSPDDDRRRLPSVDALLRDSTVAELVAEFGRPLVVDWIRDALDRLRTEGSAGDAEPTASAIRLLSRRADESRLLRLRNVVNATGIVLHTNLGRAPLADAAIQAVMDAARNTNVEIDLADGKRSHRGRQLDELWRTLTGAEASLVVNNCAAATLLTLQALAAGREVVVSRGELIEIGGSFRLPDVFRMSGAVLREVGTTNRTRLSDYESAINDQTAALLRVHPSNFRVVGFTESAGIRELAELANRRGLVAIDDVGSGALVDLTPSGLADEPTVAESLRSGAHLVLFSGDKLLGGPQCGVILGKRDLIKKLKESPLARALRIDKLTLAALHATLMVYLRGRPYDEIPVLKMLTTSAESIRISADELAGRLSSVVSAGVEPSESHAGGGSLPTQTLPTFVVALRSPTIPPNELARRLRVGTPSVVARVERDAVLLDLRTVLPDQRDGLAAAVEAVVTR